MTTTQSVVSLDWASLSVSPAALLAAVTEEAEALQSTCFKCHVLLSDVNDDDVTNDSTTLGAWYRRLLWLRNKKREYQSSLGGDYSLNDSSNNNNSGNENNMDNSYPHDRKDDMFLNDLLLSVGVEGGVRSESLSSEQFQLVQARLYDELLDLQNQVFDASMVASMEGALLRRVQVARAHVDMVFPPNPEDQSLLDMHTKQRFINRDLLVSEGSELQDRLSALIVEGDALEKQISETSMTNRELYETIDTLLKRRHGKVTSDDSNRLAVDQQDTITKITASKAHYDILRNVLISLIIGSGINWAKIEPWRHVVLTYADDADDDEGGN